MKKYHIDLFEKFICVKDINISAKKGSFWYTYMITNDYIHLSNKEYMLVEKDKEIMIDRYLFKNYFRNISENRNLRIKQILL